MHQVTNDFRPLVVVMDGPLVITVLKGPHGVPAPVARAVVAEAIRRATEQCPGGDCAAECVRWREAKSLMPDGFSECVSFDVVDIGEVSTVSRPRDVAAAMEEVA